MKVSIKDYEDYLFDRYKNCISDNYMFMKLVEKVGKVAEVIYNVTAEKSPMSET